MEKRLNVFFEKLIAHFSCREEISHIYYDGETTPYEINLISPLKILSDDPRTDFYIWLVTYLSEHSELNYYEMYKSLMKRFFNVWVNPSKEELAFFGENDFQGFEAAEEKLNQRIRTLLIQELEMCGYDVMSGRDIIDRLVRSYDQSDKVKNISDWLKPAGLEEIENDMLYIIDFDYFIKPIPLTQAVVTERFNQNFPIAKESLCLYFENLVVTKRGIESNMIEEALELTFHDYRDMDDYLAQNDCETKATTFRKLLNDNVEPNESFIEVIVEDLGEVYINHRNLHTEKDVIDFVNAAYLIEEVDREAKTFDRRKIIEKLLTRDLSRYGHSFMKNSTH